MRGKFQIFLLSIAIIFCQLNADWLITGKDGVQVTLCLCEENLNKEKEVFYNAFISAYSGTEVEKMVLEKYNSLETFLNAAFEDEEEDFKNKKQDSIFVSAKINDDKVIGFVSFDKHGDRVYIRQLVVHKDYQRLGLGKLLSFSFLNIWQDCLFVDLVTRRLNYEAINFYKKLGFKCCDYIHDGLDPKVYIGLGCLYDKDFMEFILTQYKKIN